MTACEKMFLLLEKLLSEKKSLDEIGEYICDGVEHPRLKAIRLIKTRKGEQYLKDNAEWLGYVQHTPIGANNKTVEKSDKNVEHLDSSQPQPKLSPSGYIIPDNVPSSQPQPEQTSNEEPKCFGDDNFCVSKPKLVTKDKLNYCPCGCGYGYLNYFSAPGNKWYSPKELEELKDE